MTNFVHKVLSSVEVESGSEDFGVVDAKGRKIGTRFTITQHTTQVVEGSGAYGWLLPHNNTTVYEGRFHVTRDGRGFGASHGGKLSTDVGVARSRIYAGIAASRKRYQKQFGK